MSGQRAAQAVPFHSTDTRPQMNNALAERFAGLVITIVNDHGGGLRPDEREDLRQAGLEGLCLAAQRFDPSRGVSFPTFAYFYVKKAVLDERRRLRPLLPDAFVHQEWAREQDHWVASQAEHVTRVEGRGRVEAVEGFVQSLPPAHKRVVRAMFYEGRTQAETARHLGVSRPRVNVVLKKVALAGRTALQEVAL